MTGGKTSRIKVTLRNPWRKDQMLEYFIDADPTPIGHDWVVALKELLATDLILEKNFCFLGFPQTQRTLDLLCDQLNESIRQINLFNFTGVWQQHGLAEYFIEDWFAPDVVRYGPDYPINPGSVFAPNGSRNQYNVDTFIGLSTKQEAMNRLHNHFERLQGTVEHLSGYYLHADYDTKYAIRQLNNLCHEIENLVLAQRKQAKSPQWIRPSQITTWLGAPRKLLKDDHRQSFISNKYDRRFGQVFMHWTQIGKTLFEVYRDENAPRLKVVNGDEILCETGATCEAITALKYYSGEFDIEWGRSIVENADAPWHDQDQQKFRTWLVEHGLDPNDPGLSLGYLPVGQVHFEDSFGTDVPEHVWQQLAQHLDICKITVDDVSRTFDYCWTDSDWKHRQIEAMKPGYDHIKKRS